MNSFHTFTHDEKYIGRQNEAENGQYDAPNSIIEARGKSIVADPWARTDHYGNPVHIYYSEFHLSPNITGYGFFDNPPQYPHINDVDVYNLGFLSPGSYEITSSNNFTTFEVIDSDDQILNASNFNVIETKEHHLILSGSGTYSVELNQLPQLDEPGIIINSPNITGLSAYDVNENLPGAIIGRIYANDVEDGNNIAFSIQNTLERDVFEITGSGANSYLKLKDNFSADYETDFDLSVTVHAEDTDGNIDLETFTIIVNDELSDNPEYDNENLDLIFDRSLNHSAWINRITTGWNNDYYSQFDLEYNSALKDFYEGSGFYSEIFIKSNWDPSLDLQYDPNADWYVDGSYTLLFTLSTEDETTYLSKYMDGGERNIWQRNSFVWSDENGNPIDIDPSVGTYNGYSIGYAPNGAYTNEGRFYRYDGEPFKLDYSGFFNEAFDIFQPFPYLNDPWISGNYYKLLPVFDADNSSNSLSENAQNGYEFGIDATSFDGDPVDTITYTLSNSSDGLFSVYENSGIIYVADNSKLDYEQNVNHLITVRALSSDGDYDEKNFLIDVINENETPTSISLDNLSVDENIAGAFIANISGVDPDGDELTYNIEGIGDYHMFHITDNVLHLNDNISADYENKQQLEVTLQAEDPGGLYTEQFFTIDVLNDPNDDPPPPNETPTSISLDNLSVDENIAGAFIANISGVDPDGDELTYNIEGIGDYHMFHITDNVLHLNDNISADYENKQQLEVTLQAEDPGGLYTEQFFTIDVLNDPNDDPPPPNETPTSISLDNLSVDENIAGAFIANISGVDPDGDELTYNIEGIGDYHMFHITDNVLHLNDNISADYENKQQLEVTLQAEDPGGLYTEQFFTIDVLNDPNDDPPPPNETPTSISLDNLSVDENIAGAFIANISGVDPDGDELTYNIEGIGDYHMFHITDNVLHLNDNISADYENKQQLEVTLQAEDPGGLYTEQFFTIDVLNDPNDDHLILPPSNDLSNYFNSISEDIIIPNVTNWNTSSVITMDSMFRYADTFNQDISTWDISSVTSTRLMFADMKEFNQDISNWNTSSVTDMSGMFMSNSVFNQNISDWDTSFVTDMNSMFMRNSNYNQDISNWDTSSVTRMDYMFYLAEEFDQDLSGLEIQNVSNMRDMLDGSSLSTANYDATLNGWYQQALTTGVQTGVNLGADGLGYSVASSAARQALIDDFGWTINGDSLNEIDTAPPVLTGFEIVDTTLSVDEQIVINFNATDDSALRRYNGEFTYIDDTGYHHKLSFFGTPILMEDGSFSTHGSIIPTDYPSGDYALTRFFIEDVNSNEYWKDSSEPFWNDINTIINITNPNDVIIDTAPPVLTGFEIVDTTLSVDEQIVINFNATDDSALRRYNGEFTYIDDTGYHHKLSFFGTPILMEDGSFSTHGSIIPTDYPSGDYALTRFFIEDVNSNEYWKDSSEPFWNDINTIINITNPNDQNEAPTSINLDNLNVNENIAGAHIANITGYDFNNDALTFSIVEGEGDASMFMVMNNMLHLKTNVIADFETRRELEVTIRATDQEDLSIEKLFIIDVNDDKSDNTSDTEVTFSANLDDLGTFTNDIYPNFYFTVNGELESGGWGTTLLDLALRDEDDNIQFNPSDSRVDRPEVTYNSESNVVTFTYDMSPTNPGFYSEDYEILIGMTTFSEALTSMARSDGTIDAMGIRNILSNTLQYMGLNGGSEPNYNSHLSELQSWYEQSYVVSKLSEDGSWVTVLDAEKPSWSELEQAFNEKQSILSIDDNLMILNSINTSDTEVTFSANLDDLGTFTNDIYPNFYFTVNGELESGGWGTTLLDLALRDEDDNIQFNPSDSRVDRPEVTYNSESNVVTFTYDMSPTNPGFYSEDYEILIGMTTFSEALTSMARSDGTIDAMGIRNILSNTLQYMGLNGGSEPNYNSHLSELQSWYEQSYVVSKLSEDGSWVTVLDAEKPSWSELEQAFNEKQSILSIDDNLMILNSINTSDTEVTFSANLDDLGTFTNDIYPNFYFTVNGELESGGWGTTLLDLALRDEDDNIQFNPSDSRVDRPEVTYNSESNVVTFTYDMSPTNPGFYSEDYEILIGMTTFSEALTSMARSDGTIDAMGIRNILSNTLQYMGLNGGSEPNYNSHLSELQSWYEQSYVVSKLSEDGSWVTVLDAEKPSWSELEQAFNEKQSILSIDDNLMILNYTEDTATFTASIDKWGGDGSNWLDGPVMKLHHKDIADEVISLVSKPDTPGHKYKPDIDKGSYELRVEHDQDTDGAINIDDVMGVLSISRGITQTTSDEHKLAADWNGDGTINIDDVMGVLSRSRGIVRDDEWRFHDKASDTSLWDNATKTNKMDIVLDEDNEIDLTAILRGDVNASYNATQHNRADPSPAPTPNPAPLPLNNDDELLTINPDIV
jgi:surface protein